MKNKISLSFLLVMISVLFLGMYREQEKDSKIQKTNTNDLTDFIAINQMFMWFSNNGMGSHDPIADGSGLFWPGGRNGKIPAIFTDGFIFGGKVGTEIRVGGATYRYGLQAGPIINGKPADPSDPKYRIYKIVRGWESMPPGPEKDRIAKDYAEWPVEDGAPWVDVDGDGVFTRDVDQPHFIGDEVNWMVMNDMDPSRTTFLYGTQPMGMEVQCTIFGFNRTGPLGDMVFKKYKLINKGNNTVRDMVVSYWSDPDLGYANDDYVGCDTLLSLGYVYNGDNNDEGMYGAAPPAAGYDFFQGPVIPYDPVKYPIILEKNLPDSAKFDGRWIKGKTNLPLTSFSFYINGSSVYVDPDLGVPNGSIQMYNYMTSRLYDGSPFIDPNTGQPVKFCLAGDPVAKTGWYEGTGWPGGEPADDRRLALSSGSFTMAPGDTQEVVVGILIGRGGDNIGSVKALKDVDFAAQTAYNLDFKLTSPPPAPKMHVKAQDGKLTLYWEDNAESYIAEDPLIKGQFGIKDWTYNFQGYEVYQYSDEAGSNPVLLATYDIEDNVTKILDWTTIQGENVLLPVAAGSNSGLYRTLEITTDAYSQEPLHNGTPYYFGVVAYAYNEESAPKILKNTHVPVMARPESASIDEQYVYDTGDYLDVTANEKTDVIVKPLVINPDELTGDNYKVIFKKAGTSFVWSLINLRTGDTLLANQTTIMTLADLQAENLKAQILKNQKVNEGFVVAVANPGYDATNSRSRGIKEIVMVKDGDVVVNPSGNIANFIPREGVNVFGKSSTRGWWLTSTDAAGAALMSQIWNSAAGTEDDFELRFTQSGSEYYAAEFGLKNGLYKPNPLGKGTVPFEFWNLKDKNNPNDDVRLYVKSFEGQKEIKDSTWNGAYIDIARLDKDSVQYNELHFWQSPDAYTSPIPNPAPAPSANAQYPIQKLQLMTKSLNPSDFPKQGTVIRFNNWKPLKETTEFTFTATKPIKGNAEVAKENMDKISVFPNPYFGSNDLERDKYQRFMRFTNLPQNATIRIYSLAGVFIKTIDKVGGSQYVDWDLRNDEGLPVASGIYLAYIDMPGIGSKILKLAVIQEKQYIDRI